MLRKCIAVRCFRNNIMSLSLLVRNILVGFFFSFFFCFFVFLFVCKDSIVILFIYLYFALPLVTAEAYCTDIKIKCISCFSFNGSSVS